MSHRPPPKKIGLNQIQLQTKDTSYIINLLVLPTANHLVRFLFTHLWRRGWGCRVRVLEVGVSVVFLRTWRRWDLEQLSDRTAGTRLPHWNRIPGTTARSETAISRLLFLSLPFFPSLIHLNFFRLSDSFHHFWQLLRDKIIYRCIDSL